MKNQTILLIVYIFTIVLVACTPVAAHIPIEIPAMATPIPADYPKPLGERVLFTYYFYWYDWQTKTHIGMHGPCNSCSPLTDEPDNIETVTWRGTEWHKKQIYDMIYAGIDVILPVYWGSSGDVWWSRPGIENLAKALEEVRLSGQTPPSVGMDYDTSSRVGMDVTTQRGKNEIYDDVKFFFNTIPREYWALADNDRPIIWFWQAGELGNYDSSFIEFLSNQFEKDFGIRPYIALESDWATKQVQGFDALYSWNGPYPQAFSNKVASVSPGFDDQWILFREHAGLVKRENGDFYKRGLAQSIICGIPWLAIETWNEYHEATEIAETVQYGRTYLDITHKFAPYFKKGEMPPGFGLVTPYSKQTTVNIDLSEINSENGVKLDISVDDGQQQVVEKDGLKARETVFSSPDASSAYLYFKIDDGFYFNRPQPIKITVTYFDEGYKPVYINYDAAPCGSNWNEETMYKGILLGNRSNTRKWKTISININDAYFTNNENGATDFRVAVNNQEPVSVSRIEITKLPLD